MKEIKKLKCPSCGKTAKEIFVPETNEIIIKCSARKPCFYYNKRKVQQ